MSGADECAAVRVEVEAKIVRWRKYEPAVERDVVSVRKIECSRDEDVQ